MNVVSPKEMARIESLACSSGAREEDFMEEAGKGVAALAARLIPSGRKKAKILLLSGKGNNGGDAYAAGSRLLASGHRVAALRPSPLEECSPLCRKQAKRFLEAGGALFEAKEDLERFDLIIDGLFGTGFRGSLKSPYSEIVHAANGSGRTILSIDIPSGLDGESGKVEGEAIRASETAFLGLPKLGFFLNEGWSHVGRLRFVDFGLDKRFAEQAKSSFKLLSPEWKPLKLPEISRVRHKYQAGSVAGLGGSPGMPGAALLACHAALKGGSGIVHLLYPKGMEGELVNSIPELIKIPYELKKLPTLIETANRHSACFIGPGIGLTPSSTKLVQTILPHLSTPCVLDADALTLLGINPPPLPKKTLLTPHHGEMSRLLGIKTPNSLSLDFLSRCQNYADKHRVTLILKGAPTVIFSPDESASISPAGTPGMATAGTGDVLTGLLAALLSQKMEPKEAASVGVYLHGLAGEIASQEKTDWCLMASDLIEAFPKAFLHLKRTRA